MPPRKRSDHDRIRKKRVQAIRESAGGNPVNFDQFRFALIKILHKYKNEHPSKTTVKEMIRETNHRAILYGMRKYGISGKKDRAVVIAETRLAIQALDHQVRIFKKHGRYHEGYDTELEKKLSAYEQIIQTSEEKLKEHLGPLAHEYVIDVYRMRGALGTMIDKILKS